MADDKNKSDEPEGGEGGGSIKELVEALKAVGMTIPDEVDDIPKLVIAIKASGGAGGSAPEPEPEDQIVESQPGIGMSDAERKATERASKMVRREYERQVDDLLASGRVTPQIAAGLKNRASKINLSFDDEGEPKSNTLTVEIQAYQRLPANSVWRPRGKHANLSDAEARQVDPPTELRGELTDAEALDRWDKM